MKTIALLLVILAVASGLDWANLYPVALASEDLLWDSLRVKWAPTATPEVDGFYDVPRTSDDAESEGWVQVQNMTNLNLTGYCLPDDGHFCILVDDNGFIAGCQIGLLVSDVADLQSIYNMSEASMFSRNIIFDQDYWVCAFYTVDPDIIEAGGRTEMNGLTGTDGVWLVTKDGYLEIPKNSSNLDSIWQEETCIDGMGTHYYFNTSLNQVCATIRPLFLVYDQGQLASIGWFAFGKTTMENRPWMEGIPVQIIGLINPEATKHELNDP